MENLRLLTTLADDYARLREVAARDLAAPVPSCPGWTVADLVRHVSEVYLHKTEAMRHAEWPDPWPPDLSGEEPIALLDRAYSALTAEFAAHPAGDKSITWFGPDQTVGFWIRRMAQESVIHRVDAELALGAAVAPIPADLAVDGIDELLRVFLAYGAETWVDYFAPTLKESPGHTVAVRVDGSGWLVTTSPGGVEVTDGDGDDGEASATTSAAVTGPPDAVLRWLWARGGDDRVTVHGDGAAVVELRRLLVIATQ
jgi:uncharacterized protein (TIGR03083 family)